MPMVNCSRKITTFTPMREYVTSGLVMGVPPATVVTRGRDAAAPATQSGHWKPTGAATMHSAQIGRSHRVQRMPVGRSGCR